MKTHFFKRGIAGLLSLVMCLSAFIGLGTTTAFAAGEQAEVYLISFPRSGDANLDYSGTWGHSNLHYMNGWYSGESKYTTIRAMHSYDGNICYCIEPGTPQDTGDRYTSKDETFWDNLPSDFNSTISPYDMKLFIGRIMQYGYTGPISTSWRSQNASDAETLAQAMATQVLIWETVVGERDEDFNHISPGSYDAVKSVVSTAHPLYSQFISYYNSIEASVQRHSAIPSFMAKTPGKAQNVELAWNGTNYTATLTDSNNVLSNYSFSANEDGISFSVSGNKLVITAATAPSDSVRITASKSGATRRGIITWTDGRYAPGSGIQDVISYAQEVNDPVQAFLNLKVSYGSAKIIKTSEDGKVDNLTFIVTGNGVNQTVKTNAKGEIQIDNLMPGVYTVTEMDYDKYEPQESRRVTVVSGQVSTVTFNNKLKRGDLQIIKSSEDNLNEGVTFHLYGTSLSGIAVDEYAVTDKNGVATFKDVLTSGAAPYTVEEVDTAVRYVIPEAQSAPINWNEVTNRSFTNILKKFTVTVTKSDAETGTAQGDASLAGAVYGIYKGETLVDTYTTDQNGQFVSKEYICDSDWTVREITPSEGYLLDSTVHRVGAEPQLYTVEHLVDFRIETLVDGKVVRSEQYASLEELTEKGLQALSFDDLVYLSEEELARVEAPLTPVWEQPKKSRVQTFDIHPEIPMADRHTFDLASHEVEEVNKKERFHRNYAAITVLKRCQEENRFATPDEQIILSKYVGWGGIPEAFDERAGSWQTEFGMLKNILTPEEYASARESTLTAFYTPPTVINAVYKVMKQLGFREGNILEPSCGIGHFIGMLPEEMKESKIYGVELDTVSAGIAQQLYQKSSIAAQGFEETNLPDSFFDAVVGNVPFGDFKVPDKRYDKHKFLIHDYFFAKSLDKLRPGGVMALITSKGTMDKENSAVRKYIAQRADLLGAIRLPNNTFKGNAGTEVVSDILILQKRDRIVDIEPDWVQLGTDENGILMNRYFVEHPEMILGEMKMVSGRFGPEATCVPYEGADLAEQLGEAVSNIHGELTAYEVEDELAEEDNSIPADPTVRNFSYTVLDNKIYFRENSRMAPVEVSATAENRIKGMIRIRDSVRTLIELQTEDYPDLEIKAEQERLNALYDTFSKQYGLINSRANISAFSQDSSFSLLSALEVLGDEGQLERKADTLLKNLMRKNLNSDEYVEFEKLLDEAGINAWREQVDFLGRGDGMIEHIWCEYGIDKRRFSV